MIEFILDARLEKDSAFICDGELSQLRLSRNAAFPWAILVPRRNDMSELIDLSEDDQIILWQEIRQASRIMQRLYAPTKLNVANIGNKVSQLHIHVVARYDTDKAWPGPVWNSGISADYDAEVLEKQILALQKAWVKS